MDRSTARSLDIDLKSYRNLKLILLHPSVLSDCNLVQFLAIAIREASFMLAHVAFNLFNPVQCSDIELILASVILPQP